MFWDGGGDGGEGRGVSLYTGLKVFSKEIQNVWG